MLAMPITWLSSMIQKHLFLAFAFLALLGQHDAQAQVAPSNSDGYLGNHHFFRSPPPRKRQESQQVPGYYEEQSPYAGYQKTEEDEKRDARRAANVATVSSGTGFFVSNRGHIVTNEHVVTGCQQAMVRGSIPAMGASVVAIDHEHDLALLKAEVSPPRIAAMREGEEMLRVGDPVMLIGYPKEHGMSGIYKVEEASIIGLRGPRDEAHWIQFSNSAQQGNSGGPLLDSGGNVAGVIVGKAKMVRFDERAGKEEVVEQSDIAISLPVLKKFLLDNRIYFRTRTSTSYFANDRIENQAKGYIVNIHCKHTMASADLR